MSDRRQLALLLTALASTCHRNRSASDVHDVVAPDVLADTAAQDAPIADSTPQDVPPANTAPARVTITATGDILLQRRTAESIESHREDGGLLWTLGPTAPVVAEREILVADLETPLTTRFRPPGSGLVPVTGVPAVVGRAIARAGFDVISVATNHAYDQTADGMDETLEALRVANVPTVGAGRSDEAAYGPVVVEREGLRVAFLGFTERTNDGPGRNTFDIRVARTEDDASHAIAAIRSARDGADIVVAMIHWSRDFVRVVSDRQRSLARQFVDAGADLVLGSGPHLLQRVERTTSPRGDAIIAYSLGDLVSTHGFRYRPGVAPSTPLNPIIDDPAARDGVLLRVTFTRPEPGHVALQMLTAVTLWRSIDDEGVRVVPGRALDESLRSDRVRAVQAVLGNDVRVRP
jgi:poly-gamma-glutamate synthesis protein (capsule biosynthesis protein)